MAYLYRSFQEPGSLPIALVVVKHQGGDGERELVLQSYTHSQTEEAFAQVLQGTD
jgi:hypothetical protein